MGKENNPRNSEEEPVRLPPGVPADRRKIKDRRGPPRRYAVRRLDEQRASGVGEIMDERRFVERRKGGDRRKGARSRRDQ